MKASLHTATIIKLDPPAARVIPLTHQHIQQQKLYTFCKELVGPVQSSCLSDGSI